MEVVYAAADAEALPLSIEPRLESWDAVTHHGQVALRRFLAHVREVVGDLGESDLALALHVAAAEDASLTSGGRDLDNYLFPVVRALGPSRFVSARATKGPGRSTIVVGPAAPTSPLGPVWSHASAVTRSSAQSKAWKEELAAQVAQQVTTVAPPGPVALEVSYVVSPRRNWAMLWKPTIDALGCVLGVENPNRPFMPRDDRVTALGLHRGPDDPALGNAVRVSLWWSALSWPVLTR